MRLSLNATPFEPQNARDIRASLTVVAPVAPRSGFAVLGELRKVVVAARIVGVADSHDAVELTLHAPPGEEVFPSVLHPRGGRSAVITTACRAGRNGAVVLSCRVDQPHCTCQPSRPRNASATSPASMGRI